MPEIVPDSGFSTRPPGKDGWMEKKNGSLPCTCFVMSAVSLERTVLRRY